MKSEGVFGNGKVEPCYLLAGIWWLVINNKIVKKWSSNKLVEKRNQWNVGNSYKVVLGCVKDSVQLNS